MESFTNGFHPVTRLAKGLFVFAAMYFLVLILDMQASAYLFSKIFESFLLIVIVIFAPY